MVWLISIVLIYPGMEPGILEIRKHIDRIDQKIIDLLIARQKLSREIGQLKQALKMPLEDLQREQEIIHRLTHSASGNLTEEQLIRIYQAVFTSSKQVQNR